MKAVLVLNRMPDGCVECTLARMDVNGKMICTATDKEANFIIGVDKPESCPLRAMPDYDYQDKYEPADYCYQIGWNNCLKAIEGSGEDG